MIRLVILSASLRRSFRFFVRQTSGGIAILSGFVILLVVTTVGAAVDYSQAVNARHGLSNALDSATLATARDLSAHRIQEDEASAYLQAYFDKAYPFSYSHEITDQEPLVVSIDTINGIVQATANVDMPTAFMGLAGFPSLDISVASTARYVQNRLEIALVVDVTGSMARSASSFSTKSKMEELREAVETDFLARLFEDLHREADTDSVRVSLVPYTRAVDISETTPRTYQRLTDKCMSEPGLDVITDAAPGTGVLIGNGLNCPANAALIPMTNNPKKIIDRLNEITPSGSTAGHLGFLWGWNTLSPNWADEWPVASQPLPADTPDLKKIMVFMSDGVFNRKYDRIGTRIDNGVTVADLDYLGRNSHTNAVKIEAQRDSNARARSMCEQMRRDGIVVYTIGFALTPGSVAEAVLRDCAFSEKAHFFEAKGGDLGAAFESIARDVKRIWLSG